MKTIGTLVLVKMSQGKFSKWRKWGLAEGLKAAMKLKGNRLHWGGMNQSGRLKLVWGIIFCII